MTVNLKRFKQLCPPTNWTEILLFPLVSLIQCHVVSFNGNYNYVVVYSLQYVYNISINLFYFISSKLVQLNLPNKVKNTPNNPQQKKKQRVCEDAIKRSL